MANVNTVVNASTNKCLLTSLIAVSTIVIITFYAFYVVQPPYTPHVGRQLPHVNRQRCTWTMFKSKRSRSPENPPWLSLLADYEATIRSGGNLYVWPPSASTFRLGNKLFNYAATFGIAWRNRRIPIWPENRASTQYDITKFFNLRITEDRNNTIIHV